MMETALSNFAPVDIEVMLSLRRFPQKMGLAKPHPRRKLAFREQHVVLFKE
jgi:hypothetical protein